MTAWRIAAWEFKALFATPTAWTMLAVLQLLFAYLFLTRVEAFLTLQPRLAVIENSPGLTDIIVPPLFGNVGIILLLVTPLLTMNLICAERRNKTLPLLLSAPISSADIVVGKYLGILGLLALVVALTALMPLSLLVGGELDSGKLCANLLALLLAVAAFAALGLYLSALASHPVIAALGSFGLLLTLWLLDWSVTIKDQRSELIEYLSLLRHLQNLQTGLIGTADIGYFLLFSTGCIVLAILRLNGERQPMLRNRLLPAARTAMLLGVIAALAWTSVRYPLQFDVTAHAGNSLSTASQKLLDVLPGRIDITGYFKKGDAIRLQVAQLIDRYRRYKAEVSLQFVDPDLQPEQARELELGAEGAVLVEYQGRTEKLKFIDENTLSNALLHLASAQPRWLGFLTGHGERSPEGVANFDWSVFGKELAQRNLKTITVNLASMASVPDNASLLVIAAPAVPLLPPEIDLIERYIDRGGNLLLLTEPDNPHLDDVLQRLAIRRLPGAIVDDGGKLYGIDHPGFVIVGAYPPHAITRGLQLISLYPVATAFDYRRGGAFDSTPLLSIDTGRLSVDPQNAPVGTQVFGLALSRKLDRGREQRIVVMGDSDFLSNAYLGNVGNRDVGLRLFNWLVHDDRFIAIPAKTATDRRLQLTPAAVAIIGFGFLVVMPALLLATGLWIWRARKRR